MDSVDEWMVIMAPRRAEDVPIKRVAAFGCRLPMRLPAGEILTDIKQNQWRLGEPIGCGGFGDIYLGQFHQNHTQDFVERMIDS